MNKKVKAQIFMLYYGTEIYAGLNQKFEPIYKTITTKTVDDIHNERGDLSNVLILKEFKNMSQDDANSFHLCMRNVVMSTDKEVIIKVMDYLFNGVWFQPATGMQFAAEQIVAMADTARLLGYHIRTYGIDLFKSGLAVSESNLSDFIKEKQNAWTETQG